MTRTSTANDLGNPGISGDARIRPVKPGSAGRANKTARPKTLRVRRDSMDWQAGDTAPKNGKPIWGWLYDNGIHLMRWVTAEENAAANGSDAADEYISCWVKVADESDGDWTVKFWLPWESLPVPPGVGWDATYMKWRDGPPLLMEA
jgi:hypothetical protein